MIIDTVISILSVTHMKSGNLFDDFVWRRATGGYIWREVSDGLLLVPADGKNAREETYRLGDKSSTGLFMQFARLQQTPDAFIAFANQFGMLGYPLTVEHCRVSEEVVTTTICPPTGIPRRRAFFSFWKSDPLAFQRPPLEPAIKGEFFSLKDNRGPFKSWLHHVKLIRWLVEARTSPTRSSESRQKDDADCAVRDAVWLTLDDQLTGRLAPISLIGALWLQAALAGGKEYRHCPICSTPIEISRTGGARADAVFCSDKCKSKDYRQRRATARSLHNKGIALRKIAKQIDTDLETVTNWLK